MADAPGSGGVGPKERYSVLSRASLLALIAAAALLAPACQAADAPLQAVTEPELRGAPEPFAPPQAEAPAGTSASGAEIRIGTFRRPEGVPGYEVLEERPDRRVGARGAWLLVDTRSRGEEAYTLIARDLKARYADLDAISVEFVDLSVALRYNGGAVIFNTPAGADYIGYIYGPPNNKGYYVTAAD
jgi:hypothetical protein